MSVRFIRYARPAIAAAIAQQPGQASARIRATVSTELHLRNEADSGSASGWRTPGAALSVLGPADVVGLAPDQILARSPVPGASAAPPELFASVEFLRPDLPWLFTPYAPSPAPADTLMPWLCLIAVPATLASVGAGPHGSVLTLTPNALRHLPDLAHAAEWAHVQEGGAQAGTDPDPVRAGAQAEPARFRSRLLCPTVLLPSTDYLVCLVPTFKGGVLAGLGLPVTLSDPALLGSAWTSTQTAALELPVYDHWTFTTGTPGSFAALVERLQPFDARASAGRRLDASMPAGPDGPVFADAVLGIDAAMMPEHHDPLEDAPRALVGHLAARLADDTPLAPPLYGRWHARSAPDLPPRTPAWTRTLNLHPSRRVAAGLGAEVVRRHQEEMMAAIWEQAGEIERANQLLRIAQTAKAAAEALFVRRVAPDLVRARDGQDLGALLWLAPMLDHLLLPSSGRTARAELGPTCLPALATSGAFRKAVRANGPLMRRLRRARDGQAGGPTLLLRLADGGGRRPATPAPVQAAVLTAAELASLGHPPARLARFDPLRPFDPRRPFPGPRLPTAVSVPPMLEAARALAGRLAKPRPPAGCQPFGPAGGAPRGTFFEGVLAAADPALTIPRRVRARIAVTPTSPMQASATDDTLGPILAAPKLPWPMMRPLLVFGRDWLAPALEAKGAPEEFIAVMVSNPAFIEAYMAGLNDEIGREMRWRGFPTDQRGTVFDRFWSEQHAEFPELHTWQGTLGSHALGGGAARLVIVIRGELLVRFGNAGVFLQKAAATTPLSPLPDLGDPQSTLYPLFSGHLSGGIGYFGFDLTADQATGVSGQGPGWYVVFQEPPVDLRFGAPPQGASTGASDRFALAALRPQQRVFIHAAALLGP
jgi:hypothetical protein